MSRPAKSAPGAVRTDCARCGIPVYRQLVGRTAALTVHADQAPYVAGDVRRPGANRLLWCVAQLHSGGVDLRWRCPAYAPCGREHVIDHECPAPARKKPP